jgi:branched-subunit amino acid aminotransferase/4-amino-4-deoxychorismate lyase
MILPRFQRYAVLNGNLLDRKDVQVSPFSDSFMFGFGVFETLKVVERRPEFWSDHWQRLGQGARDLSLDYTTTSEELRGRCNQLIVQEGADNAVLKIVVFRDVADVSELILLRDQTYPDEKYSQGFSLKIVHGRPAGTGVGPLKTQNYLANILNLRSAQAEGFDEIVYVDEQGRILEGATTNIFVVKNGVLYTPPLALGILPGVIRARLLRTPQAHAEEKILSLDDLDAADEIVITNSVLGAMPVRALQNRSWSQFPVASRCRHWLRE